MKSFAPKPWFAPQPVLIIGTYNKEGVANAMNAAWAGQWDMKEIMISMGNHVTTDNLKLGGEFTVAFATKKTMVASDFVGIVSAKNDPFYRVSIWARVLASSVVAEVRPPFLADESRFLVKELSVHTRHFLHNLALPFP